MIITLHGHIPSKKNSKRLSFRGHKPVVIASKAYETWHLAASYELKMQVKGMKNRIVASGPFAVAIKIWAATARGNDLTNKAESIMDLLVDNYVIPDDDWWNVPVVNLTYAGVDKKNPRAEIALMRYPEDRIQRSAT